MYIVRVLLLCFLTQTYICANPERIVKTTKKFIASTRWLWRTRLEERAGEHTDKCHLFVAYVLRMASAPAPNRRPPIYSPITSDEWENKLHTKRCWELCDSAPLPGDVIASKGHVGIVTGDRLTTSSSFEVLPLGLIIENNWGFRPGQQPVCWRYKYHTFICNFF